jgi:hypothetical protein
MHPNFAARVAYGRSIRERASCLIEAHGSLAEEAALRAAEEPGIALSDRSFWQAVAARLARELAGPAMLPAR